jgi:hypothetical protein
MLTCFPSSSWPTDPCAQVLGVNDGMISVVSISKLFVILVVAYHD